MHGTHPLVEEYSAEADSPFPASNRNPVAGLLKRMIRFSMADGWVDRVVEGNLGTLPVG